MTAKEFKKTVMKLPFRPTRIKLHTGDSFVINHPEQIILHNKGTFVEVVFGNYEQPPFGFEVHDIKSIHYPRIKKRQSQDQCS